MNSSVDLHFYPSQNQHKNDIISTQSILYRVGECLQKQERKETSVQTLDSDIDNAIILSAATTCPPKEKLAT